VLIEQPSLVCEALNHVNICMCDDEVTYETTMAVDFLMMTVLFLHPLHI
jgi:hypothetical protein